MFASHRPRGLLVAPVPPGEAAAAAGAPVPGVEDMGAGVGENNYYVDAGSI